MPDNESKPSPQDSSNLKQELGFSDVFLFGVGGMLGAGIYAIIGEATAQAGSLVWLSLAIAAVVAFMTALSYCEFVSRYPDAGGGYEYIAQAFGRTFAAFAGFLLLLTGVVAAAAISISFAEYFSRLIALPQWVVSTGLLLSITAVSIAGASESSIFNKLATFLTLLGLIVVIVVGLPHLGERPVLELGSDGLVGLFSGAALAFFSYVGFEDLVGFAEETKKPRKLMPKAVLYSSAVVFVFYVLVALSALSLVSTDTLSGSEGPLAAAIEPALGSIGTIGITVIALFATSKTVLTNVMGASRLLMDVAREHPYLSLLARVSSTTNTPLYALATIFVISWAFSLIGNLGVVAALSNVFIFLTYMVVNASLIKIRLDRADREDQDAPFQLRGAIKNVPITPVIAIALLLLLLAANVPNLMRAFTG